MSAPSSLWSLCLGFLCVALSALVASCRAVGSLPAHSPELVTQASSAPELRAQAHAMPNQRLFAVLGADRDAYLLLDETAELGASARRKLIAGGYALETEHLSSVAERPVTLVGSEGRCLGHVREKVALRLDLGGYAGASLPTRGRVALVVGDCSSLVDAGGFLLAVSGDDPSAHWIHPAHIDDAPAPADQKLGENEVWLHRFALPVSDLEIVERSVLRYSTPSCSHEDRTVILVDEEDKPIENYPGFALHGVLSAGGNELLVLAGQDDPEALRVVELGSADAKIALDTRLALFEDTQSGC